MMAIIHFAHTHVYKPEEKFQAKIDNFLSLYKKLKFKMKLTYEAWSRHVTVG